MITWQLNYIWVAKNGGDMTKEQREMVYNKYHRHCAYCGCVLEYKNMQVDHLVPKIIQNDNVDSYGNLMPSCRRCNHYKRALSLDAFRRNIKTIHERLYNIYIFKVAVDYGIIRILPFNGKFYFEKREER
jgi:5-methylcytosine-specific restriction endonuclease McrA